MLILTSPLTPAECAQRVGEATDPVNIGLQGVPRARQRPVAARVSRSSAGSYEIQMYKNRAFLRELAPVLIARLAADGEGCRLEVETRYSDFTRWLLLALLLGAGLSMSVYLGAGRIPGFHPTNNGAVGLPLVMLCLALIWLGATRLDKRFLEAFLIEVSQAQRHADR